MQVYLIGFMGSGKSTAGRKLATSLSLPFIDLDTLIEQREQHGIPTLFKEHGEEGFRDIEAQALSSIPNSQDAVISCGGGTPCFGDNLKTMKANGMVVYLRLSASALFDRLRNSVQGRPLVAGMSDEELQQFIETSLAEREPQYDTAHLSIDGLNLNGERIEDLAEQVRNYFK